MSGNCNANFNFSGSVVHEKIFQWPKPVFAFLYFSPLWRNLRKLKFPLSQDDLNQSRLKSTLWFLRKKILKLDNVVLLLCYSLLLEKGVPVAHHLKIPESPSTKNALCQIWLKLTSESTEYIKNVKGLKDRQMETKVLYFFGP
jgi:hypothetical protein